MKRIIPFVASTRVEVSCSEEELKGAIFVAELDYWRLVPYNYYWDKKRLILFFDSKYNGKDGRIIMIS